MAIETSLLNYLISKQERDMTVLWEHVMKLMHFFNNANTEGALVIILVYIVVFVIQHAISKTGTLLVKPYGQSWMWHLNAVKYTIYKGATI